MSNWLPNLKGRPGPRYVALANAIAEAVESGELRPGTRLPTRRDLAFRLGVSVHTVSSAYVEAERRGYLVGEVGRGTFVQARNEDREARFIMERRLADLADLSICRPCFEQLYIQRISETLMRMGRESDVSTLLSCRPVTGLDRHRLTGADWLKSFAVKARPEQVMVTNGVAHGMTVALATLAEPGDIVATECLTDHGIISLASVLHFRLKGLAIDEEGIIPEAFEAACRANEIKVLVTTPTFNNPTVSLMPTERRQRIAEIALRYNVKVVEDDVFGALLEDPLPPLTSFMPEDGYYLTSFTKTTVSGLRTGFLVAPERMIRRLAARMRAITWMATPFMAELACQWINDGTIAEMLEWQRAELKARHRIVDRVLGNYDYTSHPVSPNLWLQLPTQWRAGNFVSQAHLHGVAVTPGEPFVVGRAPEPQAIRVSIGAAETRAQLESALTQLSDLLSHRSEPVLINV